MAKISNKNNINHCTSEVGTRISWGFVTAAMCWSIRVAAADELPRLTASSPPAITSTVSTPSTTLASLVFTSNSMVFQLQLASCVVKFGDVKSKRSLSVRSLWLLFSAKLFLNFQRLFSPRPAGCSEAFHDLATCPTAVLHTGQQRVPAPLSFLASYAVHRLC